MAKEFFKNLPDTSTPLNASRLNGLLNGNEAMGSIVVEDVRCKNVIPNNATSRTINGITITVNSDKSITLSGKSTSTSETLITLTNSMNLSLPSGSYTFSFGNPLPGGVRFEAWYEAATQFAYIGSGNSKGSVNITSDLSNFRTLLAISSGATVNTTIKYMLEEGTTATEYTPYKAFGIESGSNENGNWVKFEDGTMIQYGTLDNSIFLNSSTISSTVQNLTIYRSNNPLIILPVEFIDTTYNVHIEIQTKPSDSRLVFPRIGGTYTVVRFELQLLGLEDFIKTGAGYTNLTSVKWTAIGRWK